MGRALFVVCMLTPGCGLLVELDPDPATGDADAPSADAGGGTVDANAPVDAPGPVDAGAPVEPVCAGEYRVLDHVSVGPTDAVGGWVDLAVGETGLIAVVARFPSVSVEFMHVYFHEVRTLADVPGGGGVADPTFGGPPRIGWGEDRFHIAHLEDSNRLVVWAQRPGANSAPDTTTSVRAFAMADESAPDDTLPLLYVSGGGLVTRDLPSFTRDAWPGVFLSGGALLVGGLDFTWDPMRDAYALVVAEFSTGRRGHVWYGLVSAEGSGLTAPVDLLDGAAGSEPWFFPDASVLGVRLTLAGDKAVVSYRYSPTISFEMPVIDVVLVDRATTSVTARLFPDPASAPLVQSFHAAGPSGTFGMTHHPPGGDTSFQLRSLADGAVIHDVALEGLGDAVAVVPDPTDLGDFLVARKPLGPGQVVLMRIGCAGP